MKLKSASIAVVLICLSACATLPPVDYQYTPAIGLVKVSVVQSLACSTNDLKLFISNAQPTITPIYEADPVGKPLQLVMPGSDTADTDFTLTRYKDGRLKGINSTWTGQGETIAKDLILIGSTAAVVVGAKPGVKPAKLTICAELKSLNKKDGVVEITYSRQIHLLKLAAAHRALEIHAAPASHDVFKDLSSKYHIGPMKVSLALKNYDTRPAVQKVPHRDKGDYVWLKLQKVQFGKLTVLDEEGTVLESMYILVPRIREKWQLPVPKPRAIGKSTFAISVAQSGAVTSVEYARGAGAPSALNVLSTATTAAMPQSAADKLAALKAQDDLIAENNRHVKCLAHPAQCQ